VTYDGTPYFSLGRAPAGDVHAAKSIFGPALCDAAVAEVDDSRRYTLEEVLVLDVCPTCRSVARVRTSPLAV
jgi:hypothetical protein